MPNPDDSPHQPAQDPEAAAPDPVTGSTEHATWTDQAAENRASDPPG